MTIKFQCACGKQYSVNDQLAGKRAKCKACGATVEIPAIIADEPLADLDSIWDEEAQPASSEPQDARLHTPQPRRASRQKGNLLRWLDVVNLAKTLKGPGGILTKTLAAAIVVPMLFALMNLFTVDKNSVLSFVSLVASSILAAIAAFVLSMFDFVKQKQQQGKTVAPILRLLFTRSLFHIVGWGIVIGVGLVALLISVLEP